MKLRPGEVFTLIREAALAFGEDKAPRLAAAVAYYSIFAIAPMLFFALAVASGLLANADIRDQLFKFLGENLNESAAEFVKSALPQSDTLQRSTLLASLIGFGTLFMASTGLFVQIQDALNSLWGAEPGPVNGLMNIVKARLKSFALVLGIGVVIIGFLIGNTYLTAIAKTLGDTIGLGAVAVRLATLAVGVGVLTLVFAALYKVLPNVRLKWAEVWTGAAITALFFSLGQLAIAWYLGGFVQNSPFAGAAGALVAILLWVYYSAMIFFFGAEVTWVYSQKYGSGAGGAVSVTKKEALIAKGAHIDPTPSEQEREGLEKAAEMGKPIARSAWARVLPNGGQLPRVLPEVPTRAEGRLLPTVRGTLWSALLAVLAVPSVVVLRVLGLTGGKIGRRGRGG